MPFINKNEPKIYIISTLDKKQIKVEYHTNSDKFIFEKEINDEDKNIIGHKIDVRIFKTKNHSYDKSVPYSINFYNEGGFNQIDEYARLFVELEVVKMGGAGWITYPTSDGEEKKIQEILNKQNTTNQKWN